MTQISCECQISDNKGARKDNSDEPLGEYVERGGYGQSPTGGKRWAWLPQTEEKIVHTNRQPERDEDVRNQNAGVDVWTKGKAEGKRGVESGLGVEVMASDGVD